MGNSQAGAWESDGGCSPLVTKLQFGNPIFERFQLFGKISSGYYREAGASRMGDLQAGAWESGEIRENSSNPCYPRSINLNEQPFSSATLIKTPDFRLDSQNQPRFHLPVQVLIGYRQERSEW